MRFCEPLTGQELLGAWGPDGRLRLEVQGLRWECELQGEAPPGPGWFRLAPGWYPFRSHPEKASYVRPVTPAERHGMPVRRALLVRPGLAVLDEPQPGDPFPVEATRGYQAFDPLWVWAQAPYVWCLGLRPGKPLRRAEDLRRGSGLSPLSQAERLVCRL